MDPYLPPPPQMPKPVIISQVLQRYRLTSHITGKNSEKEKELKEHIKKEKEYKKALEEYDKNLKKYNDEHLGQKLSRAKSVVGKSALTMLYTPNKKNE